MTTRRNEDVSALLDEDASLKTILAAKGEDAIDEYLSDMTESEAARLMNEWEFLGRRKQLWPGQGQPCGFDEDCGHPSGQWITWLLSAGRGFGKTFVGAHATHRVAMKGEVPLIHLIAPSPADYRDVMIEGPSGLQAIAPKYERPEFRTTKRALEWPNGVRGLCFSSHDPDALRGPQCGFIWGDEPSAWQYGEETFDMAQMGLRLGRFPQQVLTTTPKPYEWLRNLMDDPSTHLTTGTTYENMANLPPSFRKTILRRYEGTTLGRQELLAEYLQATLGALWNPELLESTRKWVMTKNRPRAVVAVDPAVTSSEKSDETGIVVVATDDKGEGYVVEDLSGKFSPDKWARVAIGAYYRHAADVIVGEVNNGGDMVESTLRSVDQDVSYQQVRATRGKALRAQPVVALFEQDRAHLLGTFPELEHQLVNWVPDEPSSVQSPDRLDAMVYGFTETMLDASMSRLIA